MKNDIRAFLCPATRLTPRVVWELRYVAWAELIIWEPDQTGNQCFEHGVGTLSWWPDVIIIQSLPAAGADVCWNTGLWLVQSSHYWPLIGSWLRLRPEGLLGIWWVDWEPEWLWLGSLRRPQRLRRPEVGVGRHYVNTYYVKVDEGNMQKCNSIFPKCV